MGFYQSRKRGGNRKKRPCSVRGFCTLFKICRHFAQQNKKRTPILIESTCVCSIGVARLELAASCSQSRRATNCATPRHPAARLHRQSIVYRFLRGSSIQNPQLTALHGLLFFSRQKRQLATAEKGAVAGAFYGNRVRVWCNCQKADAKTIQSAKLVAL